jgi:glycosyltransferase involved in cell wall biosynthesis
MHPSAYNINPRYFFILTIYQFLKIRQRVYLLIFLAGKNIFKRIPVSTHTKFRLKSIVEKTLSMDSFHLNQRENFESLLTDQCKPQPRSEKTRILIDIQPLKQGTYFRGIGRYSLLLIKNLCYRHPQVEFILYATNIGEKGNLELLLEKINLWGLGNARVFIFDVFEGDDFVSQESARKRLEKQIIELNPSHVLTVSNFENPMDVIQLRGNFFWNSAILIHDLIPLHYVKDLLPNKALQKIYHDRLYSAMVARIIFTNSHFTSADFERITGRRKNVTTIGGAGFFEYEDEIAYSRKDRKGILCIGADTPHKNIKGLLQAYALMPDSLRINHPLHIVGIKNQSLFEKFLVESDLSDLNINFLEFVDDVELAKLYSSVALTVVPSFIEGLSMPIFESWSSGTPVLVSEKSVMHEIVGRDESTFDPHSTLSISNAISGLLIDDLKWSEEQEWLLKRRIMYRWDLVVKGMDSWIREEIA